MNLTESRKGFMEVLDRKMEKKNIVIIILKNLKVYSGREEKKTIFISKNSKVERSFNKMSA